MRAAILVVLAMAAMGCGKAFPCARYCWSHKQVVADEVPAGAPDGRYDVSCMPSAGGTTWNPPLPPLGFHGAELCVAADVHEAIAKTVASIQDPTLDASQACDLTELQVYADFVEALALQARDACIAYLTCNGSPVGCDIDPSAANDQACTVPSAEILCDQVVLAPALAALSDLSNGPDAAQPQRDGTVIEYIDDPQDCAPLVEQDTEGTPVCNEGAGGGDGADESSGGGADESSGGGTEG